MGINSLHFPDDRAAGAQTVSTVRVPVNWRSAMPLVAEINFGLSTIALRAESMLSRHQPNELRLTFA